MSNLTELWEKYFVRSFPNTVRCYKCLSCGFTCMPVLWVPVLCKMLVNETQDGEMVPSVKAFPPNSCFHSRTCQTVICHWSGQDPSKGQVYLGERSHQASKHQALKNVRDLRHFGLWCRCAVINILVLLPLTPWSVLIAPTSITCNVNGWISQAKHRNKTGLIKY